MAVPPQFQKHKKSAKETPAQDAKAQAMMDAMHKKSPEGKQLPPWLQKKK